MKRKIKIKTEENYKNQKERKKAREAEREKKRGKHVTENKKNKNKCSKVLVQSGVLAILNPLDLLHLMLLTEVNRHRDRRQGP